jgi:hypothetical protein
VADDNDQRRPHVQNQYCVESNHMDDAELIASYKEAYNNVSIVSALIGVFALLFSAGAVQIPDRVRDATVWGGSLSLGHEIWTGGVTLTAFVSFITCFFSAHLSQQCSRCPRRFFKVFFAGLGSDFLIPFQLLRASEALLFCMLGLLFSLVFRWWVFAIAMLSFGPIVLFLGAMLCFGPDVRTVVLRRETATTQEESRGSSSSPEPPSLSFEYHHSSPPSIAEIARVDHELRNEGLMMLQSTLSLQPRTACHTEADAVVVGATATATAAVV